MSMQNFQDNDLDNFFRRASDDAKVAFNPKAWELMEEKLVKANLRKRFYKRLFLLSLLAVFMTVGSYVAWNNKYTDSSKTQRMTMVQNKDKVRHTSESIGSRQTEKTTLGTEPELAKKGGKKQVLKNDHKGNQTLPSVVEKPSNEMVIDKVNDHRSIQNNNVSMSTKDRFPNDINIELLNKKNFENLTSTLTPVINSPEGGVFLEDTVKNTEVNRNKRTKHHEWRDVLRISGMFSPDFSSSFPFKNTKSGYNTGISLEYFLNRKFSVSVSMLKSRKIYTEAGESYSSGYGNYGNTPHEIKGNCTVTDIALNTRYFICDKTRIRSYVSAGISSYLMRREEYKFCYKTYDKIYDYRKENNHLFSVFNFSYGAEVKLTNNLAIGVEPFMKLALQGVGEGKIKLNTAGAFISLNYTLYKK